MSALSEHLDTYLALRRAVGFKLVTEGRVLCDFVRFIETAGESTIRTDTALRWARQPSGCCYAYLAQRMRAVRGFARYLHALDPTTEIPPLDLLPARKHRPTPYIYSDDEIAALMHAARQLRPRLRSSNFRNAEWPARVHRHGIGEAFKLDRTDIDWTHQRVGLP